MLTKIAIRYRLESCAQPKLPSFYDSIVITKESNVLPVEGHLFALQANQMIFCKKKQTEKNQVGGQPLAIHSVQFSPINDTLITASDDKTVKLWTVQGHRFVRSFATNNAAVRCAKFSPGKLTF